MSDSEDSEDLDKETIGKRVAETLDPEKLQEYRDIFSFFDRDGRGSIGEEELGKVMKTFGWDPKEEEPKEMVSVIDQDGDGDISFNEFVWLMTKEFKDSEIEDEIREAFKVFDKEGNGFVKTADLAEVMQTMGDVLSIEETEEFVHEADIDGDGNVNYEEFVGMLFKHGHFAGGGPDKKEKKEKKGRRESKEEHTSVGASQSQNTITSSVC